MRYLIPAAAVIAILAVIFGVLIIAGGVNAGEGGGYIPYIPHFRIAPANPEDEPGPGHVTRIVEESPVHVGGEP